MLKDKPILQTLNIFTTARCNLSCTYCNRNAEEDAPGIANKYKEESEFKLPDLKLLLAKYPTLRNVSYIGVGEPFLCRDLISMAQYSKALGKKNAVITNGTLLHHFWGDIAPHFDFLSISLHGMDKEEFARIGQVSPHLFEQLVENIRYMVDHEIKLNPKMNFRASTVYLKEDHQRAQRAARFCVENRIPTLDIQNYISNSLLDIHQCIYDDDQFHLNFLEELKTQYKDTLPINLPKPIKRDASAVAYECPLFFNTLRVDGQGSVTGCCVAMVPHPENGNFRLEEDVWNNAYFQDMRQRFRDKRNLPACCRFCRNAQ